MRVCFKITCEYLSFIAHRCSLRLWQGSFTGDFFLLIVNTELFWRNLLMHMQEVRKRAKVFSLKTGGMNKVDIIHQIQTREGNTPCFQTGREFCDQANCCWRSDCLPQAKDWQKRSRLCPNVQNKQMACWPPKCPNNRLLVLYKQKFSCLLGEWFFNFATLFSLPADSAGRHIVVLLTWLELLG